jgi:tRNA U34 5-methylaminomethyl-2-thiouridine-forming methyltransferase MnmC
MTKGKIELTLSKDGSHTLFVPELKEHYHSVNGALQESMHVFIEAGLKQLIADKINVLEFGFGTGLNAFLTAIHGKEKEIHYHSMEKYPVDPEMLTQLNYGEFYEGKFQQLFTKIHQCNWEIETQINEQFFILKQQCDFKKVQIEPLRFHLIYFDAFAPDIQPALWSKDIFQNAYNALVPGGILTTYCAKGVVRRIMQDVGFKVDRLPGPPGKREMLRAIKL